MSKRKLTAADGAHVIAARLRKDLSALFELPCVPRDSPAAPQPASFRGTLYGYQCRSLARMLEIEQGQSLTVELGVHRATFVPKGGVVADTVGMGKTAQLIALLLAQQPPADALGYTLSALVLTPEHLCHQWRGELARFAGDALSVAILTNAEELTALSAAWQRGGRTGAPRVLVASLEFLCGQFDACLAALALSRASRFDRLILDECHDAVLLNGGDSMRALLHLRDRSRKVWCVTGTPFPQGDQSVFGLHQLLGVEVKFVIVNSPFMRTDRPLPREHPFEQLKRLVYLRNTPESVGGEVAASPCMYTRVHP